MKSIIKKWHPVPLSEICFKTGYESVSIQLQFFQLEISFQYLEKLTQYCSQFSKIIGFTHLLLFCYQYTLSEGLKSLVKLLFITWNVLSLNSTILKLLIRYNLLSIHLLKQYLFQKMFHYGKRVSYLDSGNSRFAIDYYCSMTKTRRLEFIMGLGQLCNSEHF